MTRYKLHTFFVPNEIKPLNQSGYYDLHMHEHRKSSALSHTVYLRVSY